MRNYSALLLIIIFTAIGCSGKRIALFSPRRYNTKVHREAKSNDDCLKCHDAKDEPDHSAQDDCMRCHKLSER